MCRVRVKNYTRDWSQLYSPLLGAENVLAMKDGNQNAAHRRWSVASVMVGVIT